MVVWRLLLLPMYGMPVPGPPTYEAPKPMRGVLMPGPLTYTLVVLMRWLARVVAYRLMKCWLRVRVLRLRMLPG